MDSESRAQSQSSGEPRSEPKILIGQKRDIMKTEETSQNCHKRVKLVDLQSDLPSKDVISNELLASSKNEKTTSLDLNLNSKDKSRSINDNPLHPFKNLNHLKISRSDSDCGSSIDPPDEKDPMRVWKGLKQNNYISPHYGQEVEKKLQKPRGRKRNPNSVVTKKKTEVPKKEHVDRFSKFAEPSGLLNGLNPGIINHVRNSKQVRSIIEALVTPGNRILKNLPLNCKVENTDDGFEPKLSSCLTVATENTSSLSIDELGNFRSVTSLSFKAANVASQWLDLLNQDIRGRLAALRRSKKRVRAVITTELPDLMSSEFSVDQDKDSLSTEGPCGAHAARWSTLFGQMDTALSEEENHLENWLNQVKEMQLHCENGLRNSSYNASHESAQAGDNCRLGEVHNNSEKDLDVSAAAASIYSTCNLLLTMEKLPFC